MGASATASVARASTSAGGAASASRAPAPPVVSGLPAYMSVVDAGASAGAAQGRIEALQQQEQTDDRSVAEDLADRIGQSDARESMQAEDARQAAQSDTAQQGRQAAQQAVQAGSDAVSLASQPEDGVSRPDAGSGLVTADGATVQPGDEQVSRADDGTQAGGAAGAARAPGGGGAGGVAGGAGGASAGAAAAQGAPGGAGGAAAGAAGPGAAQAAGTPGPGGAAGAAAGGPLAQDVPREGVSAEPDTGAGALATGDLVLIDVELAEHQRWAAAENVVGEAGSMQRAEFIAESAGGGFIGGVASGAAMGLAIGLVSRAVPVLGPIIGGGMALHGLITRDWAATGATIGKFGEGSDTYDTLANTLASVSAVIDVVNGVLDTIGGIVGVVEAVAIGVAAGAGVLAFFTFGATAGIAIAAGELAADCEEIREGISAVTTVLNEINNELLNPCILLFRALHEFTADADPREIESGGHDLAGAAGAVGGALGGWLGGQAANVGAHPPPNEGEGTTQRPPHETPPAAASEGPEVHFQEPPAAPHAPSEEVSPAAARAAPVDEMPAAAAAPQATPPTPAEIEAMPGRQISDSSSSTPPGTPETPATPATTQPEFHPQGWVPPEVDTPPAGFQPPPPGFVPQTPGLGDNIVYGNRQENILHDRAALGTNVQRDHVLAQAKIRDMTQGPPDARLPPGTVPVIGSEALTVVAQTGAATATHGPLPHTAATFHGPDADVPQINRLRAQGGPEHISTDIVGPSRDVRLAAGYPEQATDRGWVDQLGRAHQQFPTTTVSGDPALVPPVPHNPALGNALDAINLHDGITPAPQQSQADFEASLDAAFPGSPHGPHREPQVWGVTDPDTGAVRPASGQEVMDAIARDKSGQAHGPGQARLIDRPTTSEPSPSGGGDQHVSDASGRSGVPLTSPQYDEAAAMAIQMGARPDQVMPTAGATRVVPGADKLLIGADLNPLPASQRPANLENPANAALEPRAVIGHEVIGHMEAALGGATRPEGWHEELQASARAALHTPDLSDEQRWLLLQDAAARRRFQDGDGEIYIDTERYGPAAEAQRRAARDQGGGDRGGEPSVIIDPSLYEPAPAAPARRAQAPEEPPPSAAPRTPEPSGGARSGGGGGEGAGGGAHAAAGFGARAHQVAALFLPQVFGGGGEAPTYAQQQAEHRAEFTDDNQPAAGVERVNPHYSSPPGTPDQVVALQNEILNLMAVRARAEAESQHESERVDACEENRTPIAATLADTRGGLSAVRAHEQAVQRRDAANQAQQQRQQESEGLTSGYPNQATGLGVLSVPLAAWEGFTSLASHLPGSAGDRMAEMNGEARRMQAAFDQMGAHMSGADGAQPARAEELASDSSRIAATGEQAQTSHEDLQTAADGAVGLQSANDATLAAAQQRQQAADQRSDELGAAADDRQAAADSLAAQMRAWAQTHHDERSQAIAATVARLQEQGRIVTDSPSE